MLLGVLACSLGVATAQTEWTPYPSNPVIEPGPPGAWDEANCVGGGVVFDGATYHLFYAAGHSATFGTPWNIGHATSPEGVVWTKDPANPVLSCGAEGEWDDASLYGVAVLHDQDGFRMWYGGSDGNVACVGLATSPDGSTWTTNPGNPILCPEAGDWDALGVVPRTVIFDGERYRMWYGGAATTPPQTYDWRIGYAESADGSSWSRHPEPVLEQVPTSWESWLVYNPAVVYDGSTYHMWYTGVSTGGRYAIGYAVSSDGLEWQRHAFNPVLGGGVYSEDAFDAAVLLDGTTFHMWYSADGIDYATSTCCPAAAYLWFIPAAALAAGDHGAFFQTDVDVSNAGGQPAELRFMWLPRGVDNSDPVLSSTFSLGANMSVRYPNVLAEVFGLAANAYGAVAIASSCPRLMAMSRTYNRPASGGGGTYGQGIPAVRAADMITHGERRRIIFASEHQELRTNIGCQNGGPTNAVVTLQLYASDGTPLGTQYLVLPPRGNDQVNRVFGDFQPVNGFVDVLNEVPGTSFTCYGSVLDNTTNDPMTVLPQ